MNFKTLAIGAATAAAIAATVAVTAVARTPQENQIRQRLMERFAELKQIDEVSRSAMAGVYEVRVGTELYYTDAEASHLIIGGQILDTKTRRNLTEERVSKLTAIDFASLPLKDAIVWKTGSGARRIAVFSDPNCGFCKRFEQDLAKVKDLTVYTFLLPVLGDDSNEKSRAIWCAADRTAVWRDWMVDGMPPPRLDGKGCDTPIDRNLALGKKHQVRGTPAIVFEDGVRVPGMLSAAQLEKQLERQAQPGKS
jgi:thiol:disulfide interchange protein DsbC